MKAEGAGGELRRGHQVAAQLGAWELRPLEPPALGEDIYVISVRRWVARNSFWLEGDQPPLSLRLRVGWMLWEWPSATLQGEDIYVVGRPQEGIKEWVATAS